MYQNTTARYNGYYNATELMKEVVTNMNATHLDNYNELLPVYEYTALPDVGSQVENLENIIRKASVGISMHRPAKWTDDNYVLIGQAQFMKQDYESAQKTLEYMTANFNPDKPFKIKKSSKSKVSSKTIKRERVKRQKERTKEKKVKVKEQKERKKEREEDKKVREKTRAKDKKAREKARKEYNKERKKAQKARAKARKKGQKAIPSVKAPKAPSSSETIKSKQLETPEEKEAKEEAKKALEEAVDKEKVEITKQKEGGHKFAYPIGLLWLARTYMYRDLDFRAESMFEEIINDNPSKEVQQELYPALADFQINHGRFDDAISSLQTAIETKPKRALKARYAYIIGQLQKQQGRPAEALASFQQAAKWSPDFEMVFNAKLNERVLEIHSGSLDLESGIKKLDKMVAEEENQKYADRVYFEIAMIYFDKGDLQNAAKYLKMATEAPSSNPAQKSDMFARLADLYFDQDEFVEAATYYAKALNSMDKKDKNYRHVSKRAEMTGPVATKLIALNQKDSLLNLAGMDEATRLALVKARIAEKQFADKEEEAKNQVAQDRKDRYESKLNDRGIPNVNPSRNVATAKSTNFPIYDSRTAKKDKREFHRIWGNIALVDNWRLTTIQIEDEGESNTKALTSLYAEPTDAEIQNYMSRIPSDSASLTKMYADVAELLYNLGAEYRLLMDRLDLSNEKFLELVSEYPSSVYKEDAYYYLYLNAMDLKDMNRAKVYSDLLKDQFPDSKFVQVLNDPDGLEKIKTSTASVESQYDAIFELYEHEQYAQAIEAIDKFTEENKDRDQDYEAKVALLRALCVGSSGDQKAYIEALKQVVFQYSNTPEQTRAREIIRFLNGSDKAFDEIPDGPNKTKGNNFKESMKEPHYFLLVVQDDGGKGENEIKVKANEYNQTYHKKDHLTIRRLTIDRTRNLTAFLIRKFENGKRAKKYFDEVTKRKHEFVPFGTDVDFYIISQSNYREVIKSGSIDSYESFFQENYGE